MKYQTQKQILLSRKVIVKVILVIITSLSSLNHSSALVHFHYQSISLSFIDAPATFAVTVNDTGLCGGLEVADPIDACSPLRSPRRRIGQAGQVALALIIRGKCNFEEKVRNAQRAGFHAAIVYDNLDRTSLISMIGDSRGIWVPAVFVSNRAGEILKQFAQSEKGECCISQLSEGRAWTVLVISIISLIIILSVFGMLLFARSQQMLRRQTSYHSPHLNHRVVKNLPCVTFNIACQNDTHTRATCAICLEDYKNGENLRVLPCQHDFHTLCVDAWLTKWGTFCPVCKLDMRKMVETLRCC